VITHTGASVSPAGARNFSGPVSYTVTAADGSTAAYTVIASLEPLDTIGGIGAYLTKAAAVYGGSSAAQPIPLPVDIDLSGWTNLLFAINSAGKYVALDLSACAMTGEFNPSNTSTGKGKIVSLVLPDGATSVKAGTSSIDPAFKDFAALKSVAGAGITSVSEYAFYGCTALSSVNLPAATTVGEFAFYKCTGLTSISLPAAASIGIWAFNYCTALSSVNLPTATSIGQGAFNNTGGTALTVTLGETPPALSSSGTNASATFSKTVTVKTPGAANYDSTWQGNFKKAFGVSYGGYGVAINLTIEDL
jgi:hypothetical protein